MLLFFQSIFDGSSGGTFEFSMGIVLIKRERTVGAVDFCVRGPRLKNLTTTAKLSMLVLIIMEIW